MENLHEWKNEMKMCLLCKSVDGEYKDIDAKMHKKFGFHLYENQSYIPALNSDKGKYHKYICELFNLGK